MGYLKIIDSPFPQTNNFGWNNFSDKPPETIYEDMVDYQPFDDGWSDYEEPSITLH